MIVISDTTPLRYLIETNLVHILETLFGKIIIPQAVFDELQRPKTPLNVKDWISNHPNWVEVRQADLSTFTPQKKIGPGEWEALLLRLNSTPPSYFSTTEAPWSKRSATTSRPFQPLLSSNRLRHETSLTCFKPWTRCARPLFDFHLKRTLTRCLSATGRESRTAKKARPDCRLAGARRREIYKKKNQ